MRQLAEPVPAATQQVVRPEFHSLLFSRAEPPPSVDSSAEPNCFKDLNLDQVVSSLIENRDFYNLVGYFRSPLDDRSDIIYRQEIFKDFEVTERREAIESFAKGMRVVRANVAYSRKAHYHVENRRWLLDGIVHYCRCVEEFERFLQDLRPTSTGLQRFSHYLTAYVQSSSYRQLCAQANGVVEGLAKIVYNLWLRGVKVSVAEYDGEADYSAEVARTFDRFRQTDARAATEQKADGHALDHVEAQILDQLTNLFPASFQALEQFCHQHEKFMDALIVRFDREAQFYLAYLDYVRPLRRAGLEFSYPSLPVDNKHELARETFDLALAAQRVLQDEPVVPNDYRLDGVERILVVSGPNNGGKTTLARTVGQLHYLAKLGCPVPGRDVKLLLVDEIYTHFEEKESIATLSGKLQEELVRIRRDFDHATERSLIILNEMFSSTAAHDALFLSRAMLQRIDDLDAIAVCVTFLDELASMSPKTVSMVSTVDPDDPATRTFKVIRQPADGKAYARALAQKYRLTYELLKGRLQQ